MLMIMMAIDHDGDYDDNNIMLVFKMEIVAYLCVAMLYIFRGSCPNYEIHK